MEKLVNETKSSKNKISFGVGGWLIFLVIWLIVLAPIKSLGGMASYIVENEKSFPQLLNNSYWHSIVTYRWLIIGIGTLFSIISGYKLLKIHKPSSKRFAILNFVFIQPLASLGILFVPSFVIGNTYQGFTSDLKAFLIPFVVYLISTVFWVLYLLLSKRVRDTYKDT